MNRNNSIIPAYIKLIYFDMRGVQVYGIYGEIAELCGFPDVFYFTRLFKKDTGVPSAKWR